mmetsp:Transcript_90304/g.215630  ORF Transcript_90304/g.215630 Transcript_90304/m.215630 type:complete len:263 (-) Transcript_90304:900-1688(-)
MGRHCQDLHALVQVRGELQAHHPALPDDPGAAARGLRAPAGRLPQGGAVHEHCGGLGDHRRRGLRDRHRGAQGEELRRRYGRLSPGCEDGHEGECHPAPGPRGQMSGRPGGAPLPQLQVQRLRAVPHPPDAVLLHGGGSTAVQGDPRRLQLGDLFDVDQLHGSAPAQGRGRGGAASQGHELPHPRGRAHGPGQGCGGDPRAAQCGQVSADRRGLQMHQACSLRRGVSQHQEPLPTVGERELGQEQGHWKGLLQQGLLLGSPH